MTMIDLCMGPGGYTHTALKVNPAARVYAVSLSDKQGGHRILVPFGKKDPRITVSIVNITMLSGEMGCDSIPSDHPDYASFTRKRVFPNVECDVVVCDGHVLRTHSRHPYREASEAWRLTCSQFVFALQRIKSGGRLVMLLHKVDSWCSCQLLYAFSKFSHIVLSSLNESMLLEGLSTGWLKMYSRPQRKQSQL
jgi:23S rRNA U2552 (ribose-2'-O)-methylase RlmE/FtsJ